MLRPLLACLAVLSGACAAVAPAPDPGPGAGERAEDDLAVRCARGYPVACRELGRAHLLGQGAAQDDRLAAALITKACEIGDGPGCGDLGVLSAIGRGVPQDDVRAEALSRRACEGGVALACSNLGVLTAEGVHRPEPRAEELGDAATRTVQRFRTACEAGAPEGCLDLGAVLAAGRLVARDVAGATRALRRACDAGQALGCHRLALLDGDAPEAGGAGDRDLLEARACEAAIEPACRAVGRPVPVPSARTPAARLVQEPASLALGVAGAGGFHPAELAPVPAAPRRSRDEVRRPTEALLAAVPPALRGRLDLAGEPRPGPGDDPPVDLLVSLRRHQLGGCYEVPRQNPGLRTEVLVAFLVDGDGKAAEVRAAAAPADAELEACAAEVVAGWEFPRPAGGLGGTYLARYGYESAPAGPPPQLTPPGGLRPAMKQPGCVDRKVKVPREFRATIGSATVKLAVDGNGTPVLFHAISPAPEPLVAAMAEAVRACEWTPGVDSAGRPATLWLTVQVRLDAR
jgi:TPR repeat protein